MTATATLLALSLLTAPGSDPGTPLATRAALAALDGDDTASDGRDWPCWRGPERTGVSLETVWSSEAADEPLWTKELGLGHSSFAVVDGRVYTLGYDEEAEEDTVWCLDLETGAEVWSHRYACDIWDYAHDGGTLTTPTVVGDVVYTSNREGKVFCFARETGEVRWRRDLRADLELTPPTWGFSASPLVLGERVILNVDRVVCLDRTTGANLWVTEKGYGNAYSTPAPFEHGGAERLAVLSGSGLAVLEPGGGDEVAFFAWSKDPEIFPMTPVVSGERIFISAGYDRGATMLRFDGATLSELWSSRVMRNKMTGCVLVGDFLYGFDESILKCVDLEGKERWRKRGLGTGSMTVAGDRLLILDGRGHVIVAETNPEEYVELSRRSVFEDGTAWSTPILSHGRVLCRSSLGQMACLDFRGDGAAPVETGGERALPAPEAILARHVEAMGGREVLARVNRVRFSGTSESLINTVREGRVSFLWDAERGVAWIDDEGLSLGVSPEHAWTIRPRSLPGPVEGRERAALEAAVDLTNLFDPGRAFTQLAVRGTSRFEGRECYVLDAVGPGEQPYRLWFEVESGLLAGQQAEELELWTYEDYRAFEGVMLPTQWSNYEPVKGERASATFDGAALAPGLDADSFAVPAAVVPFLRTPEQLAADTARLSEVHAPILGRWVSEEERDDPEAVVSFEVHEGFLFFIQADRDPTHLSEPAEDGSVSMLSASFVVFAPERDDGGDVVAIRITVDDEPRDRLVRAEE